MDESLLEIISNLLSYDKIVYEKNNQGYVISKVNDLINVKIFEDIIENSKIISKLISSDNYSKDEFLEVVSKLNIESFIREKYKIFLEKQELISKVNEQFLSYIIKSDLSIEDKDLFFKLMYIVKYNNFVNIGTDYGITNISPFNKEINLYLINLKNGKSITDYEEIIQIIRNLYHKNRVKFTEKIANSNELVEQFKIKR